MPRNAFDSPSQCGTHSSRTSTDGSGGVLLNKTLFRSIRHVSMILQVGRRHINAGRPHSRLSLDIPGEHSRRLRDDFASDGHRLLYKSRTLVAGGKSHDLTIFPIEYRQLKS